MNCARPTGYRATFARTCGASRLRSAPWSSDSAVPRASRNWRYTRCHLGRVSDHALGVARLQLLHYEDFQESKIVIFSTSTSLTTRPDHWTYWRMSVSGGSSCTPSARCRQAREDRDGLYYEQEMNLKEIGEVLACRNRAYASYTRKAVARCGAASRSGPARNARLGRTVAPLDPGPVKRLLPLLLDYQMLARRGHQPSGQRPRNRRGTAPR